MMVPEAGLEPARYFYRGILSPLCLPIPPLGLVSFTPQTFEYLIIIILINQINEVYGG